MLAPTKSALLRAKLATFGEDRTEQNSLRHDGTERRVVAIRRILAALRQEIHLTTCPNSPDHLYLRWLTYWAKLERPEAADQPHPAARRFCATSRETVDWLTPNNRAASAAVLRPASMSSMMATRC